MKTSIKTELSNYILDCINDGIICNANKDEWHNLLFNQDYYIIGYYNASQWLKSHNIGEFEAIEIVRDYETDNFGEFTTEINSERIVNMLVYIYGEELIYSEDFKSKKQLKKAIKKNIKNGRYKILYSFRGILLLSL
jgi:hypothetical protein